MKLFDKISSRTLMMSLAALFVVLLLGNSFRYLDNDFGWHILTGKRILEELQVPYVAEQSHLLPGGDWVDHEWLIDVLAYLLYDKTGYIGVSIVFAAIIFLLAYLIYRWRFGKLAKSDFWFVAIGLFGFFAARNSLGVRMQEVTLLGLLLELKIIDAYQKSGNPKKLYWLPPLFAVWANLHAGFLIGFVILAGWFSLVLLLKVLKRWESRLPLIDFDSSAGKLAPFALWSAIAAVSTLVNPYGWRLYDFLFTFGNTYYLTAINEWLPFYYFPQKPMTVLYICLVAAALVLLAIKSFGKNKDMKIDLWWLGLVSLFLLMSLKSRRHVPLLVVVSIPWLVDLLAREFPIGNLRLKMDDVRMKVAIGLATVTIFAASVFSFTKISFTNQPFNYYCGYFPCEAVAKIKSQMPAPERMLNDFNWGGYLLWQWPGLPLFIDGRQPQHQYEDHTVLEEYHQFFKEGQVQKYLDKHRIDMALLAKPRTPELTRFNKLLFGVNESDLKPDEYLIDYLKSAPDWRNCYEDELAIAFCKK